MNNILLLIFLISTISYSEIQVRIVEPLRFRNINSTEIGPNQVLATSQVEVYTDNKEEDIGKRVVFKYPDYLLMTNRKKWVKVKKIGMELKENEIILDRERVPVVFYAILDKRDLDKGEKAELIEGEYIGQFPVVFSVYKRRDNYPVTLPELAPEDTPMILPSFPDTENGNPASPGIPGDDRPTILPSFPDEDIPTVLPLNRAKRRN